jgi:hypothetical protein
MPDIEYRFGTGHGDPHVHHTQANVDVNHDGVADGVALDFDGDGRVDDVMWDSDGDGVADTALLDLNDDGKAESAYHDPSNLGTWNAHGQGGTPHQEHAGALPPPADHAPLSPHATEYEPYHPADGGGHLLDDDVFPEHDHSYDTHDAFTDHHDFWH